MTDFASHCDLRLRKGYQPQITEEFFETAAISPRDSPTYTIKDEQDKIRHGKVYRKSFSDDSFTIELVSNASAELFPDITLSSSTKCLPEQRNLGGQWEVTISEISYPSIYKMLVVNFKFFDEKTFKVSRNLLSEGRSLPLHY